MIRVVCPGCGEARDLAPAVQVGDLVSCVSCAGVVFRLLQQGGAYLLQEVPQASCPQCETVVRLPEPVRAGATVQHCGKAFIVTYAYGTYALTPAGVG
jgi:hypothetical protein